MKVFVYFNLHKKTFSIKALEGEKRGLVISHANEVTLTDVTFKVSETSRQRVIREKRKNVHAGVCGQWNGNVDEIVKKSSTVPVTYNPYKYSTFVNVDDESPVHSCTSAYLVNKKVFVSA